MGGLVVRLSHSEEHLDSGPGPGSLCMWFACSYCAHVCWRDSEYTSLWLASHIGFYTRSPQSGTGAANHNWSWLYVRSWLHVLAGHDNPHVRAVLLPPQCPDFALPLGCRWTSVPPKHKALLYYKKSHFRLTITPYCLCSSTILSFPIKCVNPAINEC